MPGDRQPDGEVWWVYSPRDEGWAGLRIGHFGVMKRQDGSVMDTEGATPFFILGEVPYRSGIRIWENVSKREGWVKVRQIGVPTKAECEARIVEPDFVVTETGEAVPYDRDNLPLTKDELAAFAQKARLKWPKK